jgi:hypothetical protein
VGRRRRRGLRRGLLGARAWPCQPPLLRGYEHLAASRNDRPERTAEQIIQQWLPTGIRVSEFFRPRNRTAGSAVRDCAISRRVEVGEFDGTVGPVGHARADGIPATGSAALGSTTSARPPWRIRWITALERNRPWQAGGDVYRVALTGERSAAVDTWAPGRAVGGEPFPDRLQVEAGLVVARGSRMRMDGGPQDVADRYGAGGLERP